MSRKEGKMRIILVVWVLACLLPLQAFPKTGYEVDSWKWNGSSWVYLGIGNPDSPARCWAPLPQDGSCTDTIQWIQWALSGTRWEWDVKEPGIYGANGISLEVMSDSDVVIDYEGFEALQGENPGVDSTVQIWYALTVSWAQPAPPDDPTWVLAEDLNSQDDTLYDSPELELGLMFKKWNMIEVKDSHPSSEYSDDATVHFRTYGSCNESYSFSTLVDYSISGPGAQCPCGLLRTYEGEDYNDWLGVSVSGAGDVNRDGYDDVIVGARTAGSAGRAYVYSGLTGGVLWTFDGEEWPGYFGISVSGAGDVNNDDYDDVIVGDHWNDTGGVSAGRAYVYCGQTGNPIWTFTGEAEYDEFGYRVSGAGDVNNDGYDDLIVGTPFKAEFGTNAGQAYVYSGQTGALLWTWDQQDVADQFGMSVSGVGDVDTDGYDDFIVGAPNTYVGGPAAGKAYVFSGQTGELLWYKYGQSGELCGYSVSGAGDVNGDDLPDVIIGFPKSDVGGNPEVGRAKVYTNEGSLLHTFSGEATDDWFGRWVSGAGDVDNDGYDDLIVGAPRNDAADSSAGRVYVYSGRTGDLLCTFTGEGAVDYLGWSVSGAGDLTGDGYADVIIGAPGNDLVDEDAGRTYVYDCFNEAPQTPQVPSGPAEAEVGTEQSFSTVTTDPDGNDLFYRFAWGDGAQSGWIGPYGSGDPCSASHSWTSPGGHYVKAKARDIYYLQTDWSDSLFLTIYVRGDANGDGLWDLADAVHILNYLFKGGPAPDPLEAGDANCDGAVDLGDAVHILNYLFKGGPAPGCP
jgi:hypothetical protein